MYLNYSYVKNNAMAQQMTKLLKLIFCKNRKMSVNKRNIFVSVDSLKEACQKIHADPHFPAISRQRKLLLCRCFPALFKFIIALIDF